MKEISIARLRELLTYDPQTGELRWISARGNHIIPGRLAGYISYGYRILEVDRTPLKAHRVAWALHYDKWPTCQLDHINRDRSDNRIANLRQATFSQNHVNSPSKIAGRPKGIYRYKKSQRWCAHIKRGGKIKHLGVFASAAEAGAAFERVAREVYGEFAYTEAKP